MSAISTIAKPMKRAKALVFSAILQKELRSSGRRRSTYLIRGGYAALFSLVTLLAVGSLMPSFNYESQTARTQMLSSFAEALVMFVAWFQFIMIVLVAPSLTSPAICEEKRMGTLSALMTSPLTSLQIVVGKLTGRMYQVVLLTLISAPMLLTVRVFGGVPAETVLAFTSVTLATALLGGAMGILFSVWHSRSAPAAIFTLLSMGLLFLMPFIVYYILRKTGLLGLEHAFGLEPNDINVLAPIGMAASPPVALMTLTRGGPPTTGYTLLAGTPLDRIWVLCVIVQLLYAGFFVMLAAVVLRRYMVGEAGGQSAVAKETTRPESKLSRRKLVRLGSRPIYWREVSRPLIENRLQLWILIVIVLTAFGYAYLRNDLSEEPMHLIMGLGGLGVIVLLASVQTTGAINGERDAQTWDVLMTTPVSPWRVVLEKYFASLVRLWPLYAFVAAHFAFAAIAGYTSVYGSVMVLTLVVVPPMLYLATGLFLSMICRKGVVASVLNIGLILLVWIGLPVVLAVYLDFRDDYSRSGDRIEMIAHGTSPMGLIASILVDDVSKGWEYKPGRYHLANSRVSRTMMMSAVGGLAAGHILLTGIVLYASRLIFNRCSGRTS